MRKAVSLAVSTLLLAWTAGASAQQLENPRTDYTAYTRPKGRVSLGLLKTDLGIIDEVTIGTYPLPWLAFPLLKSTIPNVYAKVRSPWSGPLTLAIAGSFLFVDGKAIAQLADKSASASAISTTAEFDASYRFDHRFSLSVGLDYARLRAVGGKDDEATSVEGASSGHTYSTRLLGEWRLSRVFALSLLFRYLIYQSPINVDTSSSDSAVTVTSNLSAESTIQKHFTLVPGVSFEWERWELNAGVGYGVFYLPALGLATAKSWPVVDLGFAYRFDIYH
ncbi:MAG TPA: hypothetical protein VER11_24380 [Polyangiaceae bacterium]|nr:hypothetical protein [Polyangiaceae bacterium]